MVSKPPRASRLSRIVAAGALALLLGALLAHKAWLLQVPGRTFYEERNDYPALTLGHGINLDFWREGDGPRRLGWPQTTHPGIPFQLASGLVYGWSHAPGADATSRAIATTVDPSRFWFLDRVFTAGLFLATLCVAFALTVGEFGWLVVVVPLAVLGFGPSWTYGLDFLGNESFALPLFLGLWFAVRNALRVPLRPGAYALAGVAGGICYLNKLNYVAWLVAAFLALSLHAVRTEARGRDRLGAIAAFGLGAGATIAGIGIAVLGPRGFAETCAIHVRVLLGSGHYGEGDADVVKLSTAWANLRSFVGENVGLSAWLLAVLVVVGATLAREGREGRRRPGTGPMAVFLLSAFGLAFLAALKHYYPHYMIPAVVVAPFAVLSFASSIPRAATAGLVAFALVNAVRTGIAERAHVTEAAATAHAYRAEVDRARELPLPPGRVRVWTYAVRAPEYRVSSVVDDAWHPELLEPIYQRAFPDDRGVFRDPPPGTPWEYVILTREYFPTVADVPAPLRTSTVPVFEGEHLLVLRRSR